VEEITTNPSFLRLTSHISSEQFSLVSSLQTDRFTECFLTWAPKLYVYYLETMSALMAKYPDIRLPFWNCKVFASFALNFGPRTVCYPHIDIKNLAFGWCCITALGDYDHRKGGHLVLWDVKMVIEFPPGTTIYLPSALLIHSNTSIAANEERFSFAMYSAGGLFRWVEHNFVNETTYSKMMSSVKGAMNTLTRWTTGLALFSTMNELEGRTDW